MEVTLDRKRFGPWALITGAASGIGREFARQIAASHTASFAEAVNLDQDVREDAHYYQAVIADRGSIMPWSAWLRASDDRVRGIQQIDRFGSMRSTHDEQFSMHGPHIRSNRHEIPQ
jgi:NAD(P)-dependent dehydrogenase (short-subunit alcohol dehydrogenase family)